jgi:hypothetical protein
MHYLNGTRQIRIISTLCDFIGVARGEHFFGYFGGFLPILDEAYPELQLWALFS